MTVTCPLTKPSLLSPNFSLIACVEVDISNKELDTGNFFQDKLFENVYDIICKAHLCLPFHA